MLQNLRIMLACISQIIPHGPDLHTHICQFPVCCGDANESLPMLRHVLLVFHGYICSTHAVQVRISIVRNVFDATQYMFSTTWCTDQQVACSLLGAAAQWQLVSAIDKVDRQ